MFTRTCHWFLSWARWIQSNPLPDFLRSASIPSSQLCPGLRNGLFSSGFQTNFCIIFSSPVHTTCPNLFILLDLAQLNNIWLNPSLWQIIQQMNMTVIKITIISAASFCQTVHWHYWMSETTCWVVYCRCGVLAWQCITA
jgi:hypothetical protein